jgi:hypothetical protein
MAGTAKKAMMNRTKMLKGTAIAGDLKAKARTLTKPRNKSAVATCNAGGSSNVRSSQERGEGGATISSRETRTADF